MALTEEQKEYKRRWRAANKDKSREYQRRWYAKNKEKADAATREWQAANRVKTYENTKAWRRENSERVLALSRKWNATKGRAAALKRKYGITLEDYDRLLLQQNGHCALCDRTPEQERLGCLNVDHCHDTGRVRGLLCMNHNHALGRFGDNEAGLLRALEYLR